MNKLVLRSILRVRRLGVSFLSLCLLGAAASATAQTLGEVLTVAAASSQLHASVSLPSGSLRVVGEPPAALLASVPNAAAYASWEAYTARGIAMNLQPAFVHSIVTSFATSGFFLETQDERRTGERTDTQYVFAGPDGTRSVLHVIRTPVELVWLIGRAR